MYYCKMNELCAVMKGLQVDKKANFSVFKAQDGTNKFEDKEQVKLLGYKIIKALVVEKDIKQLEHIEYIKQDLSKKYKDYSIQNGDIVIPVFPNKEKFDIIFMENIQAEDCVYNDSNLIIRITSDKIKPKYLYMVLNSSSNRNKILKLCTENSRQARITVAMLEQLSIPVLTMEQQEELINRYNNAVKQLKQVQNGIEEMVRGGNAL